MSSQSPGLDWCDEGSSSLEYDTDLMEAEAFGDFTTAPVKDQEMIRGFTIDDPQSVMMLEKMELLMNRCFPTSARSTSGGVEPLSAILLCRHHVQSELHIKNVWKTVDNIEVGVRKPLQWLQSHIYSLLSSTLHISCTPSSECEKNPEDDLNEYENDLFGEEQDWKEKNAESPVIIQTQVSAVTYGVDKWYTNKENQKSILSSHLRKLFAVVKTP
uniref:uncharacterized protein n=1 Tax=Myxine glutinosa TaxID=7769 RepID=UPI00358ED591